MNLEYGVNYLVGWNKRKKYQDGERAKTSFDLHTLEQEAKLIQTIISDTKVGFCHNDLLPANAMKDEIIGTVKLIDFEYGGVNFIAFDIANHFNEFVGGIQDATGQTDYSLFPTVQKQHVFIQSYTKCFKTSICY
jgi:ethanolamine kinase